MPCASCGAADHKKSTSKKCPANQPRWNSIPPRCDVPGVTLVPYYRSFKTGFKRLLKGNNDFKTSFRRRIHHNVDCLTRVAFEASRLLQCHLQRCFEQQLPLPPFLDRTWVQKCFDIFPSGNTKDQNLNETFGLYLSYRGETKPLPSLEIVPQIKTYFVKDFVTNIRTHVKRQFWLLAKRNLMAVFRSRGVNDKHARKIAATIVTSALERVTSDIEEEEDDEDLALAMTLDVGPSDVVDDEGDEEVDAMIVDAPDCGEEPDAFEEYIESLSTTFNAGFEDRLRYLYTTNVKNMSFGGKLSPLIPLYTADAKYITIDADALWGLLGCKAGTQLDKKSFGLEALNWWTKVLNLRKPLVQQQSYRRFSFMIHTDGMGCTVKVAKWVPKQPKMTDEEAKVKRREAAVAFGRAELRRVEGLEETGCNFVGVDPGRSKVVTVVKQTFPSAAEVEETVLELSNERYYHECYYNYRSRRIALWSSKLGVARWWQQQPSARYGRLIDTLENVRYIFSGQVDKIFALRLSDKCKKLRWKVYIHQQKTFERFCREMLSDLPPDKHTVIAFGDGKFPTSSRGYAATPRSKKLIETLRRLKQRARWRRYNITVLDIWEFNTSQVCSKCHHDEALKDLRGATKPHFVRRCQSCRTIWNRVCDFAACLAYI